MWNDLVPVRIAIVAVDVSGSMPVDAALTTLHSMAEVLHRGDTGDWLDSLRGTDFLLLATFGGEVSRLVPVTELSPSAIAETGVSLTPVKGSRPLAAAVARWQRHITRPNLESYRWDVHLVTDGRLSNRDLDTFEQFAVDGIDTFVHSFTGAGHIRHALRARLTLHTGD
ncbi:VWA domain-containing protein [Umezawaea sp. Da 62-37]|uniref:VWA domain-containing protein n=1 Tax=Umezawaea sp. Da 62-37 TaxID=3075927 RepID=UPI0028F7060A|nr:VWA domain-containing protein [Umezawaea sp. Da 62-37]WNV84745.1 VWA domain-containing protein [Umezawaea sp. Da 62-37]